MTALLRKVDGRAWGALVLVAAGWLFDWDSLAEEVSDDGVVESCSYYDVLDMIVGPFALLLVVAAIATTDVGRHRLSTIAVAVAGGVGAVLVTLHGLGRLGGRCEDGAGEGTALLVFLALVVAALVVVALDRTRPVPPPTILVEGSDAPTYEGGVQRCRNCSFSSNPIDATACRVCGSTDLEAVRGDDVRADG